MFTIENKVNKLIKSILEHLVLQSIIVQHSK